MPNSLLLVKTAIVSMLPENVEVNTSLAIDLLGEHKARYPNTPSKQEIE